MRKALAAAGAMGVALALAPPLPRASTDQQGPPPTFDQIAPIIQSKCVTCHRRDGDAPFPLETFEQVRRRGTLVRDLTASGYMPPWKPLSESVALLGDRRLSDAEKSLLARWVDAGMPEGRTKPVPLAPTGGWAWGTPDLVLTLPAYTLAAGPGDVFRNFVVAVPFTGTRYVRAFQLRPRSFAVHHANIRVDGTPASAQLDAADPAPGYEGVILHSAEYPAGHFLGWTPGQAAPPVSNLAWPLTGGSDLVIQFHMQPLGRPELVQPLLGLYFTDSPPATTPVMIRLGRQDLKIRAGDRNHASVDTFETPVPVTVTAIQPHAHQRARDVSLSARLPDGSRRMLLQIGDWDFRWQDLYRLAAPLRLPAGTVLESVFHFDNSDLNVRNPTVPAQDAEWGWRTGDEMADVWVQVIADAPADGRRLASLARRKATAEDAVGIEVLIAREPRHFNLRNDAALIYLELRQPARALAHFAVARELKPDAPASSLNVGVALEELGRLEDAIGAYRSAIALDATYVPGRLRLAALRYRQGAIDEAVRLYEEALRLSPREAGARCDLARLLVESGRPKHAAEQYASALAVEPRHGACLINLTWLLAAHDDDDVRRPQQAIEFGQRAVEALREHETEALALDALAAAYASAGRFADAIVTAERAMALVGDVGQQKPIGERLALYRRGVAFRVR